MNRFVLLLSMTCLMLGCSQQPDVPEECKNLDNRIVKQQLALDLLLSAETPQVAEIEQLVRDQDSITKMCMSFVIDAGPSCTEFHQLLAVEKSRISLQSLLDIFQGGRTDRVLVLAVLKSAKEPLASTSTGKRCF